MANDYGVIEGALNAALDAGYTDVPLIFENQADSDGDAIEGLKATHIEVFFLPGTPTTIEVGENGKERAVGVYQLTIRIPLLQGKYEASQLAKRLAVTYAKGTTLTLSGVNVRIVSSAYPARGNRNGGYYELPVTVTWISDS